MTVQDLTPLAQQIPLPLDADRGKTQVARGKVDILREYFHHLQQEGVQHPGIEAVELLPQQTETSITLRVITAPGVIEMIENGGRRTPYRLGRFKIDFTFTYTFQHYFRHRQGRDAQRGYAVEGQGECVDAQHRYVDRPQQARIHPHIFNRSHLCLVEWAGVMSEALEQEDPDRFFDTVQVFVTSYNQDASYREAFLRAYRGEW